MQQDDLDVTEESPEEVIREVEVTIEDETNKEEPLSHDTNDSPEDPYSLTTQEPDENPPMGFVSVRGQQLLDKKQRLLATHRNKNGSLVKLMQQGHLSVEEAMQLVIVELLRETEQLKGNELLFETEGNLRDATTVQVKHIEALEKAAKAIHRKHQITAHEVINLDSPYIRLIITWVLRKMRDTFYELGYTEENVEVFFNKYAAKTDNWKQALKQELLSLQEKQEFNEEDEKNNA